MTVIIAMFLLGPIPQDKHYHLFADGRMLLHINNFWNVISNAAFLVAGLVGLKSLISADRRLFPAELRLSYWLFFAGVSAVTFGSGYHHLQPNNFTLVWDRLPMTVAFMALFAIIIGEFISVKMGSRMLIPLLLSGLMAIAYWYYTETLNRGDLRLYIMVQFLPMGIIPVILLMYRSPYTNGSGYWLLMACYVVAKLCEHFDLAIYKWGLGISGHTLKHCIAALGVVLLALSYRYRFRKLRLNGCGFELAPVPSDRLN